MEEKQLSHLEKEFLSLQEKLARTAHHHHKMLGQGRLLKILKEKKTTSQRELVELTGVSPQSIGEALGKLERHGFITRTQDENDKRMVNVTLTEAGEAAEVGGKGKCHKKHHGDKTALYFKDFSEEEKAIFAAFLARINANYDEAMKNAHEKHAHHHGEAGGCGCHGHGDAHHDHHGCGCNHHEH